MLKNKLGDYTWEITKMKVNDWIVIKFKNDILFDGLSVQNSENNILSIISNHYLKEQNQILENQFLR